MAISKELLEHLLKLDEHALSELVMLLASEQAVRSAAIDVINNAQPNPLDAMSPEERADVEAAFARAEEDVREGRVYSLEQSIDRLRARRIPSRPLCALLASSDDERREMIDALSLQFSSNDDMDPEDRAELEANLDQSFAELDAGLGIPFEEAMETLHAREKARLEAALARARQNAREGRVFTIEQSKERLRAQRSRVRALAR